MKSQANEMPVDPPYQFIAEGLLAGEVIPFFGAAASAVYRPADEPWQPGKPFTPFGSELATTLATAANYPGADKACKATLADLMETIKGFAGDVTDEQLSAALNPVIHKHLASTLQLAFVASWAEHVQGHRRAVDRKLRQSFAVDCQPGLLHNTLASIEKTQVYVTTNYDDLLEKALGPRKPHLIVDRGDKGLWVGIDGKSPRPVAATGNELYELLNNPNTQQPSCPIVFKMHGSIDKADARNDCYLITEEDYVDFLGRTGGSYVPPYVLGLIEGKDFLFLGYSLEDWNVRVILRKLLKRTTPDSVRFWAIVSGREETEHELWEARDLKIYPMDLLVFAQKLSEELAKHG
jgi:hypothetical protein